MRWRWCPRCLVTLYPIEQGDVCERCAEWVALRRAFLEAPDVDRPKHPGICDGCGRFRNYRSWSGLCADCGERALVNYYLLLPIWGREALERRLMGKPGRRPQWGRKSA